MERGEGNRIILNADEQSDLIAIQDAEYESNPYRKFSFNPQTSSRLAELGSDPSVTYSMALPSIIGLKSRLESAVAGDPLLKPEIKGRLATLLNEINEVLPAIESQDDQFTSTLREIT